MSQTVQQQMAWSPPGANSPEGAAVPITSRDLASGMSQFEYLRAMADRVQQMLEREGKAWPPAAKMLAESLEAAGAWSGPVQFDSPRAAAQEMLEDNPQALPLLLRALEIQPPASRWQVRRQPQAQAALRETSLAEWLDLAVPSPRSLE